MSNKYKKLLSDTMVFAIGGIGSKLILFFLVPLYTNYLSTEEYGVADLIFTVSQLLIPFASIEIFSAVIRFALSKTEKKEDVFLCGSVVWILGSIGAVLVTPLIGLYEPLAEWKWHLSLYVILHIFLYVETNYIKAKDQNRLFAIISIVQTLAMAIFNILLIVVFSLGVRGYVWANIIGNFVAVVGVFVFGKLYKDLKNARFSFSLLKRMLIYSAPLILNDISWWAIHSANKIIVEVALGAAILGIYTVATKIPSLINVMISIFQQSWGISSVKEMESSNDSTFYSNVFNVFAFLSFAASIGLILIIKPLMSVYVGESFVEAWKYIPLLLASATFSAISSYFVSLYSALKKSINNMITTLIGAVVNVVACLLLVHCIGVWGAVVATLAAYFIMGISRMIDAMRFVKMKVNGWRFVVNSVILIAEAVLVSMEIHIYLVSGVAILLFALVNMKTLKDFFQLLKRKTI